MSELLNNLINQFSMLPGIGNKTAQRLSFHIMKEDPEKVGTLIRALIAAKNQLRFCTHCGSFTEEEDVICSICKDDSRNKKIMCILQEPSDVLTIERTREFKGIYHVLNGVISPMDGIGPDKIRIKELIERIAQMEDLEELIIATNPNIEGEATALYISELLKSVENLKVTRLAYGLPVGGNLDFADDVTLTRAFERRHSL